LFTRNIRREKLNWLYYSANSVTGRKRKRKVEIPAAINAGIEEDESKQRSSGKKWNASFHDAQILKGKGKEEGTPPLRRPSENLAPTGEWGPALQSRLPRQAVEERERKKNLPTFNAYKKKAS